jgi:glycosyltransferase involved in cell wall biosynthesis
MLSPHNGISGGVKVIFKLATGLAQKGVRVCVAINKQKTRGMTWYTHNPIPFEILDIQKLDDEKYNRFDYVVNYGDGPPLTHINTKKILFLQGFVHNREVELTNLSNKYNKIITTSRWLYDIVTKIGHKNVDIVHPGIDEIFKPVVEKPKNRIPIIGTLFHPSPDKQFNQTIKIFDKLLLPYSLIVNPPQHLLPHMYSNCDIWFSTCKNEGFGLPPLEAMACNVPVVWYPNSGLDKYFNEKNCMVVRNSIDAVLAIKTLLGNSQLYGTLTKNGKELANKFTWENSINQFLRCLRSTQ